MRRFPLRRGKTCQVSPNLTGRLRLRETVRDEQGRTVARVKGWRVDGSPVIVPRRRWRLPWR